MGNGAGNPAKAKEAIGARQEGLEPQEGAIKLLGSITLSWPQKFSDGGFGARKDLALRPKFAHWAQTKRPRAEHASSLDMAFFQNDVRVMLKAFFLNYQKIATATPYPRRVERHERQLLGELRKIGPSQGACASPSASKRALREAAV